MDEYAQKMERERRRKFDENEDLLPLNDEEELRLERLRQKEAKEKQEFHELRLKMTQDKGLREDMKKQSELQLQLQQAFKRGDTATVKRLERLLAPDQTSTSMKHPWSR
jgi:hypothetical protein